MNFEFLRTYTIPKTEPLLPPPPPPPPPLMHASPANAFESKNCQRYFPPVKLNGLKRSANGTGPEGASYSKRPPATPADIIDGLSVMCYGRDPSYPDALNCLIHPYHCELCNMKMNSMRSAADHYESKTHDRFLSNWLQKTYTAKDQPAPLVKRLLKSGGCNGPSGPDAFHCELCDLKLTSLTHANQHYNGRKHNLVAKSISKPSGAGYYNSDGKWVRTGTKATPSACTEEEIKIVATAATMPDTTTPPIEMEETSASNRPAASVVEGLVCTVCSISVTSPSQMAMHLDGSKHRKKLRLVGVESKSSQSTLAAINAFASFNVDSNASSKEAILSDTVAPACSILASLNEKTTTAATDLYRTPSGLYYCKACNISMGHITALQQHLQGKRHIKRDAEERARATIKPTGASKK